MAVSLKRTTTIRLGPKMKKAAEKKAAEQEKSFSEYIRDLVEKDLKEGK
jgi:predicted HicB family RNase H-like nuclease